MTQFLIYGATGYTGLLCAREAARRGLSFKIGGRSRDKVDALSKNLGVEGVVFEVDDTEALNRATLQVKCVLNAAGPFAATARQVMSACLEQGASYIDITGEFEIFRLAEALSERARAAGVMLMPGAGWDVVPSDCVAAHTAARVADARKLRLALAMPGSSVSRGTLRTILTQGLATMSAVRRAGEIVHLESPPPNILVDFSFGRRECALLSTGDLMTGYLSTGIPDIEVYLLHERGKNFALPEGGIEAFPKGPTAEQLRTWRAFALAEVTDVNGRIVRSQIETKAGYAFTAEGAIEIASRILHDKLVPGFQGPASAYGPSLATDIGGEIVDLADGVRDRPR